MMTGIPITPASAAPPAAPNTIFVAAFAANPNRWNKRAMPYARANRQHVNAMTIAAENRGRMLLSCGKLRTRRESAPDAGAELLVELRGAQSTQSYPILTVRTQYEALAYGSLPMNARALRHSLATPAPSCSHPGRSAASLPSECRPREYPFRIPQCALGECPIS
jgi:hypothetical protein